MTESQITVHHTRMLFTMNCTAHRKHYVTLSN